MNKAVVAVGGWAHPGDDIEATIRELLSKHGVTKRAMSIEVVSDPAALEATLRAGCDLLVVGACWFAMTDDRYTGADREEHAYQATPGLLEALDELRRSGCPVLALHTAVICFDGATVWREWLGGTWNWETSWHPDPATLPVRSAAGAPLFEPFTVVDELYQGLSIDLGAQIIAESEQGDPLVWTNETEHGRAAVDVLGHDHRSLNNPGHRALLADLVDWLVGNG